jgi:hypothetical protein
LRRGRAGSASTYVLSALAKLLAFFAYHWLPTASGALIPTGDVLATSDAGAFNPTPLHSIANAYDGLASKDWKLWRPGSRVAAPETLSGR